jgi:hypothetical protein
MKKWVAFLFICLTTNSFSQTNVSPQFSELKGMEDQLGNTHLFYRIQTDYSNPPVYQWSNHIYHWDLNSGIDTFFLYDGGLESRPMNYNTWVSDLDFWNNNFAEFIYCGGGTNGPYFEGSAYVKRFDGYNNYFGMFLGSANYVDISSSNDSLLFLGINTDGGLGLLSSSNGGRNWDSLSVLYQFLSLNQYHENIYFVENEDRELLRTTDSGITFTEVDTEQLPDSRFYYDANGTRIYRVIDSKLKVSNNNGAQNSWQLAYSSNSKIHLSVYNNAPGAAWLATGRNLYSTDDGGVSFQLLKSFEYDIVGIHANSNSPFLYVATKYHIYEWDLLNDIIRTLKSLEPPDEYLKWYPLSIGNKWAYEVYAGENGLLEFVGYSFDSVVGDTIIQNGFKYFILSNKYLYQDPVTSYLRIDTTEAVVYNFDAGLGTDFLHEDLNADLGDTVCYENYIGTFCKYIYQKIPFNKWGLNSWRKDFESFGTAMLCSHSLVKGIGLYETVCGDFINFSIEYKLVACIVDGVIYGDTSLVVSVEDKEPPIATDFKLEQNYPNPFNPTTSIQYAIGIRQFVILKVYDVLGNEIATLVNEELPAGEYEVEFSPETSIKHPASGFFFYRLTAGSYSATKKMIYLK